MFLLVVNLRNVLIWVLRPQILLKLEESWLKVIRSSKEMVTVFSVTFFLVTAVGEMIKAPPQRYMNDIFFDSPVPGRASVKNLLKWLILPRITLCYPSVSFRHDTE